MTKKPKRESASEQLKRIIRDSGMTQAELGRLAGIPKETLSRFLNGVRGLSLANLDRLGECLELRIESDRKQRS